MLCAKVQVQATWLRTCSANCCFSATTQCRAGLSVGPVPPAQVVGCWHDLRKKGETSPVCICWKREWFEGNPDPRPLPASMNGGELGSTTLSAGSAPFAHQEASSFPAAQRLSDRSFHQPGVMSHYGCVSRVTECKWEHLTLRRSWAELSHGMSHTM